MIDETMILTKSPRPGSGVGSLTHGNGETYDEKIVVGHQSLVVCEFEEQSTGMLGGHESVRRVESLTTNDHRRTTGLLCALPT